MKKVLFIASALFLFSCGNEEQEAEQVVEDLTEEVSIEVTKHGEEITEEGAISPEEFLTQFEGKESLETKITTTIDEVCSKKGCWMTLDLGNDKNMRVTFKDYEFFVPKDAAGKIATIKGVATMDTTTVEMLQHYAADAGDSQEEIDAITEPEYNYAFEAIGVIIKEK